MQIKKETANIPGYKLYVFVKKPEWTRMHFSRMHTARLRIVLWGEVGIVTWSQGGGREVLWPGPGGGRCCDLVPEGGGRCCDLVLGGEVLWPGPVGEVLWSGPRGEGGVVTLSRGGGRCSDLVPGCPPPPLSWTDRCLWKHTLRSLRYAGGN